jgi:hypothetical protein
LPIMVDRQRPNWQAIPDQGKDNDDEDSGDD